MGQFKYTARDKTGKKRSGLVKAESKREATVKLREKNMRVLNLDEIPETALNKEIYIGNPVKLKDFVIFIRQFSTLLRAGVTILDSTRILSQQTESKYLRKALTQVHEDLNEGLPLSECAAKHKRIFPPMFINMVRAGEVSGALDDTLERLGNHFEKQHETTQKIKSALSYPFVVAIIAVAVVIFLLTNVVPTFAGMFLDFGDELPAITQFVLAASDWMKTKWWIIIFIGISFVLLFVFLKKNNATKYYMDYIILRIPLFGKLVQKAMLARMTRTLSSLFASSVPILQAIAIVEKVVENEVFARVLHESRISLEQGISLTEPMRKHWAFPPLVTQMITIGEETGSLDAMLAKVADFYEMEVNTATDQLKSLIEPLMIVFLAAIVGTIVMAIMVPMFEIFNQVDMQQ